MVYSNKFVLAVLVNGTPQQELDNGSIVLPFDSEYALRFRNKHNRRAVVKFTIDGEDVSGGGYIIPANDYIDIKRHDSKDVAFKFVSLDSPDAIEFGKNGPNTNKTKGVIEAKFYLEKEKPVVPKVELVYHHHYGSPWVQPSGWPHHYGTLCYKGSQQNFCYNTNNVMCQSGLERSFSVNSGSEPTRGVCEPTSSVNFLQEQSNIRSFEAGSLPIQDGCTVEGNGTGQTFSYSSIDYDASSYTTLKVFLQGHTPAPKKIKVAEKPTEPEVNWMVNLKTDEEPSYTFVSDKVKPKSQPKNPNSALEAEVLNAEAEELRLRKILAEAQAESLRMKIAALQKISVD